MPYKLWEASSNIFSGLSQERLGLAAELPAAIHEHGLKVTFSNSWDIVIAQDVDAITNILGGAESDRNLQALRSHLGQLRYMASYATRFNFMHSIRPFVQSGNRSVESALRNIQPGVFSFLKFITDFVGKDVKNPLKFFHPVQTSHDYGRDPQLTYSEEETGTYHTLQTLGSNQQWTTYSTYLEDSPLSRRYLRYIDHLANRYGMRLVYTPKRFRTLDDIVTPEPPLLTSQEGRVVRHERETRYQLLFVTFAFDYEMFRNLTVIETEVQPGQRPRMAYEMDYSPIFVDNLEAIVRVINTLGAFLPCKIYYKDFRNSARSLPAAPSF